MNLGQTSLKASELVFYSMTSWNHLYFSNSNDPTLLFLLIFKFKLQTTNIFSCFSKNYLQEVQILGVIFLKSLKCQTTDSKISSWGGQCPAVWMGGEACPSSRLSIAQSKHCFLASWCAGRDWENVRKRVKAQRWQTQSK